MDNTRTKRYQKLFWLGMLIVVVLIGGRIAWVRYSNRTWNHFANRETDFRILGKPYQPKWQKTGELMERQNTTRTSSSSGVSKSLPPFKEKITQELASDAFGSGAWSGEADWVVTASAESSMHSEHYVTVSIHEESRSKGKCRLRLRYDYTSRTHIIKLSIQEGYGTQGREVTLYFRLTPDGFVHVEDLEER